ncbi:HlyD family secretion protein [Opitutus terrae]|uniref:Secretion protein HlyD family protein n=1 Tax=Opitutus terrae (strain DSM 11246 / JCM 15787 / PB90-1) TaxID=452637 RepID=B1ZPQ2_OPITP|nr:HlyD family secretion protein [Opitutus terrae]ACB75505.1 secretion protein HlyD family protein [Opitutus terrae PB90-1]
MSTDSSPSADPTPAHRWRRRVLLLAGPLLVAVAALWLYLHGGRIVTSDNAYVHADKLTVTAEVAGAVKDVAVRENQPVAVGQVLFRLDDEPYRIALAEAQAELAAVRLELATSRANYQAKVAAIGEAQEQLAFAETELHRQEELNATNVAPAAALDQARHAVESARRRVSVLQQEAATVLASLGGVDRPDEQNPDFLAARARVAKAQRDLARTVITAPIAGIVANVTNLPVGKFLQPAQPAFTLVAADHVWIEANLKETELTHLQPGNPVKIEIDTYPHRQWLGRVAAIGPATGAEFALIPPQNASGNWVKTVQRIPVRIRVESNDPARPLRAGMSAEVRIDTGHTRALRDLAGSFGEPDQVSG